MAILKIDTRFEASFRGELVTSRTTVPIGSEQGKLAPYDMLLGALASCLYATFLDIVEKKRIQFRSATLEVSGEKRSEIPTTLKWVCVRMDIAGGSDKAGLQSAAELAGKYCSIYQTLSHVAEMKTEVSFSD